MKKIFELSCNCVISRNDLINELKGGKGKLRKIILKKIEEFPEKEGINETPKRDSRLK